MELRNSSPAKYNFDHWDLGSYWWGFFTSEGVAPNSSLLVSSETLEVSLKNIIITFKTLFSESCPQLNIFAWKKKSWRFFQLESESIIHPLRFETCLLVRPQSPSVQLRVWTPYYCTRAPYSCQRECFLRIPHLTKKTSFW